MAPGRALKQRFVGAARTGRCSFARSWAPASTFHAQRATVRHPAGEIPRDAGRGSRRRPQGRSLLRHPPPKLRPMQPGRGLVAGPLLVVGAAGTTCCVVSDDNDSRAVLRIFREERTGGACTGSRFGDHDGSGSDDLSVSALSGAGAASTSQSPRSYRRPLRWTRTAHARAGLAWRRRKHACSRRRHSARPPWRHRSEP